MITDTHAKSLRVGSRINTIYGPGTVDDIECFGHKGNVIPYVPGNYRSISRWGVKLDKMPDNFSKSSFTNGVLYFWKRDLRKMSDG